MPWIKTHDLRHRVPHYHYFQAVCTRIFRIMNLGAVFQPGNFKVRMSVLRTTQTTWAENKQFLKRMAKEVLIS